MRRTVLFALSFCVAALCLGQRVSHIVGLEGNAEYMSLIANEKELYRQADSVQDRIDRTRLLLQDTTQDRNKVSGDIIRMEGAVFQIRNAIGTLSSKISRIEQDYVIASFSSSGGAEPAPRVQDSLPGTEKPFFGSDIIVKNLPAAEVGRLVEANERYAAIPALSDEFLSFREHLAATADLYSSTGNSAVADSCMGEYARLRALADDNSARFTALWDSIFEIKSDAYNLLLDKLGGDAAAQMQALNEQGREIRIGAAQANVLSKAYYAYPRQQALVIDYELFVASRGGLSAAKDSLERLRKQVLQVSYDFADVSLAERSFVTYEPFVRKSAPVYSASNPVPEFSLMRTDKVFSIQIMASNAPAPVSRFRNAYPLFYTQSESVYRYFTGKYKTLDEAKADLPAVKRLFSQAFVVGWADGKFYGQNEVDRIPGAVVSSEGDGGQYVIEILTAGDMSDEVKMLLAEQAPDKDISRVQADDGYLFTVGLFNDHAVAAEIATELANFSGVNRAQVKTIDE